eukprot:TRINITY_DN5934_c0_g1_i2.p1 TRINITY_DN5934_c0_g1~~TRINITY_DN5934_c0_g1_i2.p1  ORF type:complete len:872 (+),score=211.89 TRINITY_DN5934_c0_g1_i2:323-2617(+)
MALLNYLHEPNVLHHITHRYAGNEIYTYCGKVLVAMNPFRVIPKLYDTETLRRYHGAAFGSLPAHVFAISEHAYFSLMSGRGNQSVVVSGESGAGKTESTKLLLKYLAEVASVSRTAAAAPTTATHSSLTHKILQTNPLLEAFGNAKTVNNDNSSRFGKYIQVFFDLESQLIVGATISTYLLEKSRVVGVAQSERGFHIFYQLLSGLPEGEFREKLGFSGKTSSSFCFLKCENPVIEGVDDTHEFSVTRGAMNAIGITEEEQEKVFSILSAILHLGELKFSEKKRENEFVAVENQDVAQLISRLLSLPSHTALVDALNSKIIKAKEILRSPVSGGQAIDAAHALAKALYAGVMGFILTKINQSISPQKSSKPRPFIGLLDIFGFECFETNSLEQLFINYANEKLQNLFILNTFVEVKAEYSAEGIPLEEVSFEDNAVCLALIDAPSNSVISFVNEICLQSGSAQDIQIVDRIEKHCSSHPHFISQKKQSNMQFGIQHYAQPVTYTVNGWVDKNRDTLHDHLYDLISSSSDLFVSSIFAYLNVDSKPSSSSKPLQRQQSGLSMKTKFLGFQFREELSFLVDSLSHTQTSYVRCIRPNTLNKAKICFGLHILRQLRSSGLIHAIRMARAAFANRIGYIDFLSRFHPLAPTDIRNQIRFFLADAPAVTEHAKNLARALITHAFSVQNSANSAAQAPSRTNQRPSSASSQSSSKKRSSAPPAKTKPNATLSPPVQSKEAPSTEATTEPEKKIAVSTWCNSSLLPCRHT